MHTVKMQLIHRSEKEQFTVLEFKIIDVFATLVLFASFFSSFLHGFSAITLCNANGKMYPGYTNERNA